MASEIRAWMGRRRWSQAALAGAIGRSEMYVSRGLRGLRPFSTDDLFRIADALSVPADVFLHVARDGDAALRQLTPAPTPGRPVTTGAARRMKRDRTTGGKTDVLTGVSGYREAA